LWNTAASNLRTRCLTNSGTGSDCSVGHRPELRAEPVTDLAASGDPIFVSSGCVAVQTVNILRGHIPIENCTAPQDAESVTDSLYDALPEIDQLLASRDSLASTFTVTTGQSIILWTRWQRGGVRLRLTDPVGVSVDSAACSGDPTREFASDPAYHWAMLALTAPAAGTWTVHASTDADSAQHVNLRIHVTGDVTFQSTVRAVSTPGQPVHVEGALNASGAPITGATVNAQWNGPNGTTGTTALHDDGLGPDATAGDGVYSGQVIPPVNGAYGLELKAAGGSGPAYGARASRAAFRVALALDIRMAAGDVTAPQNWVYPGDALLLQVHVHNAGGAAADSVWFSVRDDSTGQVIKDSLLAVPGGGAVIVPVTFSSSRRGFHHLSLWAVAAGDPPDSDPSNNGAAFPLQVVEFGQQPQVGVPPNPAPVRIGPSLISRVVPSPSHDFARIEFLLPQNVAAAHLTVFDISGRVLARFESGSLSAGWQAFVWDIRGSGERKSAGVYFYRVEGGGRLGTGSIVLR
jgi:hypothetical protein